MSTKVQSLIKLLLVFVVSLLSFSVGTYVGFKFSENKQKLAVMEPHQEEKNHSVATSERSRGSQTSESTHSEGAELQREIASVSGDHEDSSPSTSAPMTDEEIAKLAEEFVSDEPSPASAPQSPSHPSRTGGSSLEHHAVAAPSPAKAPASATQGGEQNVPDLSPPPASKSGVGSAPQLAPGNKESKSRLPQSLPPRQVFEGSGKFTVQVSSFAEESEAKQKALNLKNQGYNAFYVPTEVKGKKWYRVSIGLFNSELEARSLRENFLKENPDSSAFIQKVPVE